jgi:multiple sugar transport system substrate-binding protein
MRAVLRYGAVLTALGLAAIQSPAQADAVEITLAHPYGKIFRPIHEKIIAEFGKTHPDIKVKLEAPLPDYEELVQRTLAGVAQGNAPVLSFQGINQVRQFVDAGHAYNLSEFAAKDARWQNDGYYAPMMALGAYGGKQYAIPFAVSTPIMYFNADLFKKAGLDPDKPPRTWPEVIAAAKKIQASVPDSTGLFYDYLITGNWGFQALVYSEGGSMMDAAETRVAFADEPGLRATRLLRKFVDDGVMKDWNRQQGEQSFIAGTTGFYVSSTSWLKGVQDKAKFDLRTSLFPEGSTGLRKLPSGGNAAIVVTKDPAKAKAAYEYAMFAAGPIGTAIMVSGSGYMPMHAQGTERLKDFYQENPNFKTSIEQIPYLFPWYAFPGQNTLKVIDVVKDSLQSVVAKRAEPDVAVKAAAGQVTALVK